MNLIALILMILWSAGAAYQPVAEGESAPNKSFNLGDARCLQEWGQRKSDTMHIYLIKRDTTCRENRGKGSYYVFEDQRDAKYIELSQWRKGDMGHYICDATLEIKRGIRNAVLVFYINGSFSALLEIRKGSIVFWCIPEDGPIAGIMQSDRNWGYFKKRKYLPIARGGCLVK